LPISRAWRGYGYSPKKSSPGSEARASYPAL
jgi:hypothetical protein